MPANVTRLISIGIPIVFVLLFLVYRPSFNLKPNTTIPHRDTISDKYKISATTPKNPEQGSKNHISGIDVSHYQGDVVWGQIDQSGITFVYLKATEGMTYVDPRYNANKKNLQELNIPHGAYHFFEPGNDSLKQAQHFLKTVAISNMLPPVLDVEIHRNTGAGEIKSGVLTWLKEVESKTGCRPIIYTYKSFWENYLGNEFSKYPLWLADYASIPTLPGGVSNWLFWQHSQKGKVKGISTPVDLNIYNGSDSSLQSLKCEA